MAAFFDRMKEARKIVSDSKDLTDTNLQAVKENVIGNDALKRGEFDKAIRHFTAALDLDPQLGTFGFFTTRAIAAYKLGRYVDCLEDVKLAQKVDSKAVLSYRIAFKALKKMGCVEDAFAYQCKCFTLDPAERGKALDGQLSKLADDVFAARLVVLDPQPEELDLLSKILNIAQSLNSSNKQLLSSFAYEAAAIILANDPSASPSFFVSTLITLSEILQSLGEHHASLAHLNHLEAIANSSDQLSLIVTYRLQGSAHYELKDFRNSLVCYEKELKVIEELEDSEEKMRLKAENFCHLGSVYHVIGDFHKSISILEDYLKIGRQLQDRKVLSEAHRCLGKAHAMLGNCRQASWHFNTQLNVARKAGNKESQAMALKELGRLHRVLQRPQEAVKCQEQELNVCTSEKMRASCLNLLGLSHYQLKNYDVAMGYYEEARVAAQQIHNKTIEASVCCNISLACHSIGNFLSAVSNLTNALHIAESLQDLVIQLDCHSRLGSFYFGAEKTYLKLAERHLRAAIELFEAMRHDWGSYDRMKTEIIEMPVGVYHKLIHLLVERGETRDALTIAECCLAREYVEKTLCKQDLQSVNAIRQLPAGIMTYDAVTKMVSKINCPVIFYTLTEYGLYIWVLYPGGRGLVKFHHWSKDAVKYLKPFLQQTYQVVSTLPANIPSRVCEPRACPKVTRPVMNGDGSVEVNGGQDDDAPPPPYCSLVSVAHRHGLTYSSVGNDDILHPARSSYLAAPAGEGYATVLRASMRELYDVLVKPIDKHLPQMAEDSNDPVTDLVIVPHGNLYLLPFASLVTSRRTLLSTPYSIRVLPCLQTLHINSQPRAQVSQGLQIVQSPTVTSVLVVGNPALPNTVKFHGKSWEPNNLPFAEREAKHVALLLGPGNEALLGRSATRNAVLSKLSQAKVIHVATHGSWEFGAFSVAPSKSAVSETEDGEITDKHIVISPSDITKIRLCASLVVLSGYNNVREQDLITADSLLATARSFLTAGAHCVVISMWSPPDRATDEMMYALYEGLQRGLSVAAAVQEGMAYIRSRRGFTDPIHWSGFVVIGENICLKAGTESPETCRAIWLVGHGGYDKLQVREMEIGAPGKGQVRVAVQACGLNFAELMMRQGLYKRAGQPPYIPGFECSGTVEVVGDEVQNLEVGQRVVCVPGKGGWSEKVVVNSEYVFPIPDSMSFEEAAAIPVNYITAYMMLFNVAHLRPGKKLLIHMAAGGVGTAVTQLAQTVENVTIFGTASASKHDVIRKAGVTHPIDYRTLDYEQEIRRLSPEGIDIVLDPLAGKDFKKGYNLLRPMGITVLFGGANLLTENKSYLNLAKQWFQTDKFDAVGLIGDNKTVAGFDLGGLFGAPEAKEAAVKLIQLYEEGEIKPRIDSTFSFDQIADAQKRMHDRQNIGKIILVPYKEEEQKPEAKPEVEETEEDKTAEKDKTAEEDKPTEDGE